MLAFIATLLRLFFQAFRSKRNVLSENALLKKGKRDPATENGEEERGRSPVDIDIKNLILSMKNDNLL